MPFLNEPPLRRSGWVNRPIIIITETTHITRVTPHGSSSPGKEEIIIQNYVINILKG